MLDLAKRFEYENGFYLTSDVGRMGKMLAQYELYKTIVGLPGDVVECGVFKGASLVRFATFRELLESPSSRRIVGFDTFGAFPEPGYAPDRAFVEAFVDSAGEGISVEAIREIFARKNLSNCEFVKGDILRTVPEYVAGRPQLKIALLHIDTDTYEPAAAILEHLYDRVVRGGVVLFDDYGTFPGETRAVDDFFAQRDVVIRKLPISHIPAYLVKP
jgi:hypothetical protein